MWHGSATRLPGRLARGEGLGLRVKILPVPSWGLQGAKEPEWGPQGTAFPGGHL